jgi:pyrimidine-specific ribonucleoside hydrolase
MQDEIDELRNSCGRVGKLAAELLDFYFEYYRRRGIDGAPLHDPCAVAYLIKPDLFTAKPYHIDIECAGEYTSGMTLADRRLWTNAQPNATVCLDIDRPAFIRLLIEACKSYG